MGPHGGIELTGEVSFAPPKDVETRTASNALTPLSPTALEETPTTQSSRTRTSICSLAQGAMSAMVRGNHPGIPYSCNVLLVALKSL